jgi:hypothetical protein
MESGLAMISKMTMIGGAGHSTVLVEGGDLTMVDSTIDATAADTPACSQSHLTERGRDP